ncbi:unnamed protein product [Adineta steineri]|uniref:Ubiquitin thioesterase OTU n=1 Tax=Adineta steineri TaxID=433720 RepID=A0A818VZ19_9BILA|nr:unnamed protein product [Adineta steineri]
MTSNISTETHEFGLSNRSDFYTCFVLGTDVNIDSKTAYKLVQDIISCRTKQTADTLPKNINEENKTIVRKPRLCKTNNATVTEDEIEILCLLTKTRLCIIYVTKHNEITSSIRVQYYGNDYKESIYLVYDDTQQQYRSLYLYNKTDPSGEKIAILPSYNETINILLRKFFINHVDVQLDDELQTTANEVLHQGQLECGELSNIIDMDTGVNTSTEQGITDNDEYSTMSATTTTTDNQISSNVTTNISETTYTLHRKEVPGDGSCLYWSFRYTMSLLWLTVQDLRNQVADHIFNMDIDDIQLQSGADRQDYCDKIKSGAWGDYRELIALSEMYDIRIKVVNLRKDLQPNLSIKPIDIGKDGKLYTKCIYVIYDKAVPHYEPLYLRDMNNLQNEITTFGLDDTHVDDLLPDFIKRQIDSNHLSKGMIFTDHMLDEFFHMLDSTVSKTNSFNANEQYASANNIISTMQNIVSSKTHEFCIGELPGDDQSLYASVIFQFDRSKMVNVKCLRKNVADVILSHTDTDGFHVPLGLDYDDRKDYCRKVEEGIISGSEPERNGLSYLYPDTLFCIISKPDMNNNAPCIDIYVKDISSYKKCIIILYDEDNNIYLPLYLHNKINDEEEKTNFKYDDTVKNLLREFIQNKLEYCGYVNFDSEKDNHAMDSPLHIENESDDLSEIINDTFIKNKSKEQNMKKRKAPEKSRSLISSRPLPPNDQISRFHKINDIENIATLVQTDMFSFNAPTFTNIMEEQQRQIEDLSPTLSRNASVAAFCEYMTLKPHPRKKFRARALSDYVPKSETKRNGKKAEPRKPSYFSSCDNQRYLNLLIPTMYLFADLRRVWIEIALVTRTINGCIYFNPLFEFYPYNNKGAYGIPCNPMFIKLEDDKTYPLTKYTDELQKLKLKLVVIMLTNAELVKKQPLKVFKLVSSNAQTQDTKHRAHDKLKNDFQLNDVCFAITLWIQESIDKEHQRRPDIQYISPASTQDKKVKLYE